MAITNEQIFQVADELDANGQNPTLAAVRKQIGGGSYTTISEAMTKWKASKAAKENPLREPPPQAVIVQLTDLGVEIWALALELANGRLAVERENLEAARIDLEDDKAEAVELADQLTIELETMQGLVNSLEEAKRSAHIENDTLREQLANLTVRVATSEARATEIEKRADNLNAELARMNTQNIELVKALTGSTPAVKKRQKKNVVTAQERFI